MAACSQCQAPLGPTEKFCGSCGAPAPAAAGAGASSSDDPWLGQVLGERWQIHSRLASGAFGWTYSVTGTADGAPAVVKLLRQTTEQDPTQGERFASIMERV